MATLAAYFHDLDPFLVRFSGDLGIRWYGLSYVAGFVCAYFLLRWLSATGRTPVPKDRIGDALMWLIGGTIVGGRLGYVLVYDRSLLMPPTGIFAINHGGMASHGGIIGVIIGAWRVSRGWKTPDGKIVGRCSVWKMFDTVALMCPPGLFFGRVANFINGELLGKIHTMPGAPGPWWTVQFPQELIERPVTLSTEQQAAMAQLAAHASGGLRTGPAAIAELVARAGQYKEQLRPLLSSRHPSQLYQAAAEGLVLGAVLWAILLVVKPKRPGLIGAAFLVVYGVLRVVTEIWRLPDVQFGAKSQTYGLSMGQWLSVGMVVAGVAMSSWLLTRKTTPGEQGGRAGA